MLVVMDKKATEAQIDAVVRAIEAKGYTARPIPGGEPDCPRCARKMTRRVERYPAPRGGSSPFRVRLLCSNAQCGAWTVYDW